MWIREELAAGRHTFERRPFSLLLTDPLVRAYEVSLRIAEPNRSSAGLPSLLGRNVINHWYMQYDPTNGRLDCTVRHADYTFTAR